MEESAPYEAASTESPASPLEFVSVADFEAVDVNAVTAAIEGLSRWGVDLPIIRAANAADEARDSQRFRVLRLMAALMSMHVRCESEGDVLGPK